MDTPISPARAMLDGHGVVHRIQTIAPDGSRATIAFDGLLDRGAVAELRSAVAARVARGLKPRIVLRAGTVVDHDCIEALRSLEAEVSAESPYLARWLEELRIPPRRPR